MDQELKELLLEMQGEIRSIHIEISGIKQVQQQQGQDLADMRQVQQQQGQDLADMRQVQQQQGQDLADMKQVQQQQGQDLAELKEEQRHIRVLLEHTDKRVDALAEGQANMNEKFRQLDQVAEDVEEIKVKVSALEEASRSQASQIQELRIAK